MSTAPPVEILYIAGAGHSGTTLLDLLLGNRQEIAAVGELHRLSLTPSSRACACGALIPDCPYWSDIARGVADRQGRALLDWTDFPTDLLPAPPVLAIDSDIALTDDGRQTVPPELAAGFLAAGMPLSVRATVARGGGVREVTWRVDDPDGAGRFVLRRERGKWQVYRPIDVWKNPLRRLPSPLELALVLGSRSLLGVTARMSKSARAALNAAANTWTIAEVIGERHGRRFVVDSSKNAVRLKLLYLLRPQRTRVVYLVRDGRAVAASAVRRQQLSVAKAAAIWKRENQHVQLVLRTIPRQRWMAVRYEALCDDPERTLDAIGDFLNLPRATGLVRLWQRPVHNIPGNPMLFQRTRHSVEKDERWRRDLSADDLESFEAVAGRFNRQLEGL